jgi:hypothetical protein
MKLRIFFAVFALIAIDSICAEDKICDFNKGKVGASSEAFSSFVGTWYLVEDKDNKVYAVDGRKWKNGAMAADVADKAKALYGERYAEFLDNLNAYKYFPLTIFQELKTFSGGEVSVKFKSLSGRIDQAAGIAFNIKENGDYLVIRANPLENNIVAFRLKEGRRSVVKWVRDISTKSKVWHILKIVVNGKNVTGFLDGKKCISLNLPKRVNGKIGLWSKSDSYVLFDDFIVRTTSKKE